MLDIAELYDIVDSFDPRLTNCVELFRGGRAGEGCESLRVGSGGGPRRAGRGGVLALLVFEDWDGDRGWDWDWSRSTGGGGRSAVPLTPIGRLLACLEEDEP